MQACMVLNFPLTASLQFSEKLAENLSTTYKPYSLTQFMSGPCGGTMCGNVMVKSVSVFLAELTVFVV